MNPSASNISSLLMYHYKGLSHFLLLFMIWMESLNKRQLTKITKKRGNQPNLTLVRAFKSSFQEILAIPYLNKIFLANHVFIQTNENFVTLCLTNILLSKRPDSSLLSKNNPTPKSHIDNIIHTSTGVLS